MKIFYLGPEGTNSDLASKNIFNKSNEFIPLTSIEDIFDDLLKDDSSDLSINSTGEELFMTSSLNQMNEKTSLEDLLISFSRNEDLNKGKSFIF